MTHCADKKWWQEYTAMPIAIPTCWGWCLDEGTEEEEEEGGLFPNHCATITPGECRTSEFPTGEDLTMSWEWCMLGYAWEWWLLPGNIEGYVEVGSPLLEDQGSGVLCPGPSKNRTENPIIDAITLSYWEARKKNMTPSIELFGELSTLCVTKHSMILLLVTDCITFDPPFHCDKMALQVLHFF